MAGTSFTMSDPTLRETEGRGVSSGVDVPLDAITTEEDGDITLMARADVVTSAPVQGGSAATLRVLNAKRDSVLYQTALDGVKAIDDRIVASASHYVQAEEARRLASDGEHHLRVDREAVILKLYEVHLMHVTAKKQLVDALLEVLEHTTDPDANTALMQQVIAAMDEELLDTDKFLTGYALKIRATAVRATLVREIAAHTVQRNTKFLQAAADTSDLGSPFPLFKVNAPDISLHGGVPTGLLDFHTPLARVHAIEGLLCGTRDEILQTFWADASTLTRVAVQTVVVEEALAMWRELVETLNVPPNPINGSIETLTAEIAGHPTAFELAAREAVETITANAAFTPVYSLGADQNRSSAPPHVAEGLKTATVWDGRAIPPASIHTMVTALNVVLLKDRTHIAYRHTVEAGAVLLHLSAYMGQPVAELAMPQLNWDADTAFVGAPEELVHVSPAELISIVTEYRSRPPLLAVTEVSPELAGFSMDTTDGLRDVVLTRVQDILACCSVQASTMILYTSCAHTNKLVVDTIMVEEFRRETAALEANPQLHRDATFLTKAYTRDDAGTGVVEDIDDETAILAQQSIAVRSEPQMRAWHFSMLQKMFHSYILPNQAKTHARSAVIDLYIDRQKLKGGKTARGTFALFVRGLKLELTSRYADLLMAYASNVAYRAQIGAINNGIAEMVKDSRAKLPFVDAPEVNGLEMAAVQDVTDLFFDRSSLIDIWVTPTLYHIVRCPYTISRPLDENTAALAAVQTVLMTIHDIIAAILIRSRFSGVAAGSKSLTLELVYEVKALQTRLSGLAAGSDYLAIVAYLTGTRKFLFARLRLMLTVTRRHLIAANAAAHTIGLINDAIGHLSASGVRRSLPLPAKVSGLYRGVRGAVCNVLLKSGSLASAVSNIDRYSTSLVPAHWAHVHTLVGNMGRPLMSIVDPVFTAPTNQLMVVNAASINYELALDHELDRRDIGIGSQPVQYLVIALALAEYYLRAEQLRHHLLHELMDVPEPINALELEQADAEYHRLALDSFIADFSHQVNSVRRSLDPTEKITLTDTVVEPEDTELLFPASPVPAYELFWRLGLHLRLTIRIELAKRQAEAVTAVRSRLAYHLNAATEGRAARDMLRLPAPEEYSEPEVGGNSPACVLGELEYIKRHGLEREFADHSEAYDALLHDLFGHMGRIDVAQGNPGYVISEAQLARILNSHGQRLFTIGHAQRNDLELFYNTTVRNAIDQGRVEATRRAVLEQAVADVHRNIEREVDSIVAERQYGLLFRNNEMERNVKTLTDKLAKAEDDVRSRVTMELDTKMRRHAGRDDPKQLQQLQVAGQRQSARRSA